jgi:predicted ATPase
MNEAFDLITRPIARYEGTVAQFTGDGLMALFGAPISHEDDPRRAILAGLEMVQSISAFRKQFKRDYGHDFNIRIGINTGLVIAGHVGSGLATEYTAMGDAVNVAARMEQTAEAGTVQITADTGKAVEGAFELEPLGGIEVKGKSAPVDAFRVLAVKRDTTSVHHSRTPLIGRDKELQKLLHIAQVVHQGRGQVVCLIGQAGLGKSRLVAELKRAWVEKMGDRTWDYGEGVPYDASRPYSLFQDMARRMFDVKMDDRPEQIHAKVYESFRAMEAPEEAKSICSIAIQRIISAKVLHDRPDFPAEAIKADLFNVVGPAFFSAAQHSPIVVAFDDLQWADPASVELLGHLMTMMDQAPILFLLAMRPERQSPAWKLRHLADTDFNHRYTEMVLQPLDAAVTDELIDALLHVIDLPRDVHDYVLRKTEGNPYFVEEVMRYFIERGAIQVTDEGPKWDVSSDISETSLPDSLQSLLMARMDRLSKEAKSTLQLASVVGRTFYHRILSQLSDSTLELDKHITSLERLELIQEEMRLPELEYMFKHEITRDAAYSSILTRHRKQLHRQVAEAMEVVFKNALDGNAHRLAYHFSEAGDTDKALQYYEMAASAAAGLNATTELAAHLRDALQIAERSDSSGEQAAQLRVKLQGLSPVG